MRRGCGPYGKAEPLRILLLFDHSPLHHENEDTTFLSARNREREGEFAGWAQAEATVLVQYGRRGIGGGRRGSDILIWAGVFVGNRNVELACGDESSDGGGGEQHLSLTIPQLQLPIFPAGAKEINRNMAVQRKDVRVAYFHEQLPVFQHDEKSV